MRTLVTGASGLIGRALIRELVGQGLEVRAAVRKHHLAGPDLFFRKLPSCTIGDIGPETDWHDALDGVQSIIHLAARVHVMQEAAGDPLAEYRRVNTQGTIQLARMAAAAGVQRLVYVSSIKVNGEFTSDRPFREEDAPHPADPYAVSKWEAEQALSHISRTTGMQTVVVRPPLVYGPGVGGNFVTLLKWINRGIPLPLASVHNRRSLIGLQNLVSLLRACLEHPRAPGEVFLVSDGEDLSTPELIRRVARALDKPPRLWPAPPMLLRRVAKLLRQGPACERLCGSLVVDSSKANRLLAWRPASSVDEEIRRTAEWYLQHKPHNIDLRT